MITRSLRRKLTTKLQTDSEVDALFPSFNNEAQLTPFYDKPPCNNSPIANEIEIIFEDNDAFVAALRI